MKQLRHKLNAFEHWFNQRYGWFFTNGMKAQRNTHSAQTLRP